MFEGKLVSAAIHASGILDGRLRETFAGEGAGRKITIRGTIKGETEPRDITVELKDAKTNNGMWVKQPDQQLVYFATRAWARRHTPEVMLGVYSPEEFEQPRQAQPQSADDGAMVIDGHAEAVSQRPEPEAPATLDTAKSPREFLDVLDLFLGDAETEEAVDAILAHDRVQKAQDAFKGAAKERLNVIIQAAIKRTATPAPEAEEDDGWPGPTTTST